MNVFYVGSKYDGCYYVRCLLPLRHNGWDGTKTSMYAAQMPAENVSQAALAADVVVFQRPDQDAMVEIIPKLQQAGKKVVFDNDDTYKPGSGTPTKLYLDKQKEMLEKINNNLAESARRADLVTTTTEFLANEYRQYNENVVVVPNCIDPFDWDDPIENKTNKVRVGIVGSVASNNEYRVIIPLLDEIKKRDDVKLVVFAHPKKHKDLSISRKVYKDDINFWDQFDIEWQPYVPMSEYNDTLTNLSLDIMLAPREDSYFNRCKSNLKYLESAMVGAAFVGQSFPDGNSPYDKDIDGTNGRLAVTEQDWIDQVIPLVENAHLRKTIAKQANKYVLEHYDINNNAHLWEKAYNTMF